MIGKASFSAVALALLTAACAAKSSGTGGALSESSALGSDLCAQTQENGTATLACPAGQTITGVVFASYGTPDGSCGSFTASSSCDASTTTAIVTSACVGQQSCSIDANNGVFGDPCEGTAKALDVQVSCSGGSTADAGGGTGGTTSPDAGTVTTDVCATAAEQSSATVSCPSGQTISSIVFASFGTPAGTCGSFSDGSCNASQSTSIVQAACVGQSSCTVGANIGVFDDPCPGTQKTLSIEAACTGPGTGSGTVGTSPPVPDAGTDAGTTAPPTPPPASGGKVYLGAYPGNGPCVYPNIEQCVTWFEQEVGKKTAVVHAFSDFQNGWDDWFTRVINLGHTMMITINPQGTIPDILNGVYDADLQRWGAAAYANTGGAPIFFRYMHEMNLPDNPAGWMATTYGADAYIAAFQHVHDQLIKGGGTNIKHVWAPNVFWGDADSSNPIWFKPYYPGDAYADWVGLDGYPMSESDTFANQYGPSVDLLSTMTAHPIMVAEYGVVEMTPVGTWKANWFNDFFNVQLPARPQIQAVFYQDGTDGGTDHRLNTSTQAVAAYAADIAASRYASSYP